MKPKGINKNRKAAALERLAIKHLKSNGYVTHRTIRTSAFRDGRWMSHHNDVLGVIDIIAKKAGERTRWIQVTADTGVGAKIRELKQVPWTPAHDSVELWRWVGGKNNRKFDGRNGALLDKNYFQVYTLDAEFALDQESRVHIGGVPDAE